MNVPDSSSPSALAQSNRLLAAITRVLSHAMTTDTPETVFQQLLETLLLASQSEFGFLGEILKSHGESVLKLQSFSNQSPAALPEDFRDLRRGDSFELRELPDRFAHTVCTGEPVIWNHEGSDLVTHTNSDVSRPLHSYLGIPIYYRQTLVGMAGVANRVGGYSQDDLAFLQPLANACAFVIEAIRGERDRSTLDEARRTNRAILASQLEQTQDGILVVSIDQHVLSYNEQFRLQWNIPIQDLNGRKLADLLPHVTQSLMDPEMANVLHEALTSPSLQCITRSLALKGDRLFEWHCAPVMDENHVHLGNAAYFRDVTRRFREAKQLEQARQEAEHANHAKSAFLANMSHEIRTPMTAILGFTELIAAQIQSAEQKELIQIIQHNGEHLMQIINDILDLSRIEAGRMVIELIPCDLSDLIASIFRLLSHRALQRNIELNYQIDDRVPRHIQTDPTRLRQILINLLGNAIKFTNAGSVTLEVSVRSTSGSPNVLVLKVKDTGIGMPADQLKVIFAEFAQADSSTTRRFGGTGLGLSICRRLCECMGGSLTASSAEGEGSEFVVSLPLQEPAAEATAYRHYRSQQTPTQAADANYHLPARLLLAEDGPDNQRLIKFILERAGATVEVVGNGQEAYASASAAAQRGQPFDVVLMDMQMPVMDGFEATRKLRDDGYRHPIIALTAHTMTESQRQCREAGCDDFAAKPINRRALFETLKLYLPKQRLTVES